jgi:hypothetical protein
MRREDIEELFNLYSNDGVLNFEDYLKLELHLEYNIREEIDKKMNKIIESERDCFENLLLFIQEWEEIYRPHMYNYIKLNLNNMNERTLMGTVNFEDVEHQDYKRAIQWKKLVENNETFKNFNVNEWNLKNVTI